MKSLIFKIILILLPLLLFNLLLYNNNLYRFIILQNDHIINWYFSRENLNDWAEIIIMGNSLGSAGINPDIIESHLEKKQTVWNISQPGGTTSIDYFNLERIFATCRKCPNTIIYIVSEISFKDEEVLKWQSQVYENLDRLYIDTEEQNNTIKEAAGYDKFYNDFSNSLTLRKKFRLYQLRRQLLNVLKKNLYEPIFQSHMITPLKILEMPSVGFYEINEILTRSDSSDELLITYFQDYKVGKSNNLFFNRFIKTASSNNVRLIFVQMPLSPIYFAKANSIHNKFQSYINPIFKKIQIPVIDDRHYYNKLNMFSDILHLNKNGASDYSVHLANEINKSLKLR